MNRKVTTVRIEPALMTALTTLSKTLRRPMNQLINDAVRDLLDRRGRAAEAELEATLAALRAYRAQDPNYDQAIAALVRAEVDNEDPLEGETFLESHEPTPSH